MEVLKYRSEIFAYFVLFIIGALGYMGIELLWRGYSHWSMGIAGGLCFFIFGILWSKVSLLPKIYFPIIGALIITLIELIFGIFFNIILKKNIWDYSNLPFNFLGQISLSYTTAWGFLSIIFFPLAGKLKILLTGIFLNAFSYK